MSKSKRRSQRRTTLGSTKSGSGSTEQIRKYKLSRLTKGRGVSVKPTLEDDMKWFWAAYNKGAFDDVLEPNLNQSEFVETIQSLFVNLSDLYTIFHKDKAIGLSLILDKQFMFDYYQEPHISWFPWATDRNKIEGAAKLIMKLRKNGHVFVQVPLEQSKFVTHIAKYGILRRVGKLDQGSQEVYLFEAMRRK